MTLTTPNCPVADSLPKMVKNNILKIEGVSDNNIVVFNNIFWRDF